MYKLNPIQQIKSLNSKLLCNSAQDDPYLKALVRHFGKVLFQTNDIDVEELPHSNSFKVNKTDINIYKQKQFVITTSNTNQLVESLHTIKSILWLPTDKPKYSNNEYSKIDLLLVTDDKQHKLYVIINTIQTSSSVTKDNSITFFIKLCDNVMFNTEYPLQQLTTLLNQCKQSC